MAGPRVKGGRVPLTADKAEGRGRDWVKRHFQCHDAYEAKLGPDVVSRLDSEIEGGVPCCCRRAEMCEASRLVIRGQMPVTMYMPVTDD